MNQPLIAALLVLGIALPVVACSSDDSSGASAVSAGGSSSSGGSAGDCTGYSTCDTCTPVNGCGWCFNATGGQCTTDPDQCSSLSEFTWTWEPTGCPGADASVLPLDAGKTTTPEASVPETSAATDATPVEAGRD